MPRLASTFCLVLGLGLLATGCAGKPKPAPSTAIPKSDYDAAYHAAIRVLRDRGFVIDRQDHRFGVVASHPLEAGTLVEVWRPNNTNFDTALDATLNDQRRTATVTLRPADPTDAADTDTGRDAAMPGAETPTRYDLAVEVLVERRQSPNRRVGGATGNRVFTYLRAAPIELSRRGIQGDYWQPTGRDPGLEQKITQEILQAVGERGI